MKRVQQIPWFLYRLFCVYSIVVYGLVYWTPSANWMLGFLMMTFPLLIILHMFALIFWLLKKPARAVLPAVMLLLAAPFVPRTYAWGKEQRPNPEKSGFSVMHYNVFGFWTLGPKGQSDEQQKEMRRWVFSQNADILCLPEYYSNPRYRSVNIDTYMQKNNYQYRRLLRGEAKEGRDYFGLAVVSRFPIVDSKDTSFSETNGIVCADIKIRKDTVRVIAVHLYSMSLKLKDLLGQRKLDGLEREGRDTYGRIKKGFKKRGGQVDVLEDWIKTSPYPVIVCGDFNETPYSYAYGRTRELLANAFEDKGKGFGFSYNKLPYFIRIDNHFYSQDKLELTDFETMRDIKYSDHYPLRARYVLKK